MERAITILAEDIQRTSFINFTECAISRALKRAGLDAFHGGSGHICNQYGKDIGVIEMEAEQNVIHMYHNDIPAADFSTKVRLYDY